MFAVTGILPCLPIVITCILNTGFTTIVIDGVAGVGLVLALSADLEFFMRMISFDFGFIIMAASAVVGTGIIGGTKIIVADFASANHNACAIITA